MVENDEIITLKIIGRKIDDIHAKVGDEERLFSEFDRGVTSNQLCEVMELIKIKLYELENTFDLSIEEQHND